MNKIMVMFLSLIFLNSFAQASEQRSQQNVKDLVKKQTGYEIKTTDAEDQGIEYLLSQPLTENGAVAIAFLNSPVIKAQLASLGISEADMREAGILRNPIFSYKTRTSNEEGAKRNNEIEIKQDVFDVLFWPMRQKIAGTRIKASQYASAHQMTDFIKEVRLSYLAWLTAMHKQALAEDHFKAHEAAIEITRRQKEAGNINLLKMTEAESVFQKAKIERLKTKLETQSLAERLRTKLGLKPNQFFMQETVAMPDLPKEDLGIAELENKAVEHRLDLLMKRQEIKNWEQSKNLSGLGFLTEVEVGYNQESETSGHKLKGVVVEGQVPLFNRKQAQMIGIKASMETAKHELEAMEQEALLEVRLAYQDVMTSRKIVETYKEAIPLHQQMVKETLYQYNFMLMDVFHLLESKQAELEIRKEYADALKSYWDSRIELENAVGAKLDFEAAVVPMQKPDTQIKMRPEEHQHGG